MSEMKGHGGLPFAMFRKVPNISVQTFIIATIK